MRRSYTASVMAGFFGLLLFGVADPASAQPLNKLPPARAPCSVLSGQPCHPSFCEVFHLGPCFPQYLPPIGQDLRLTIVSTDETDPANGAAAETATSDQGTASEQDTTDAAEERPLDSIRAMYAALRACWVPPPKDSARHGMEYTIRFAFKRDGAVVAPPRVTCASHDARRWRCEIAIATP